MNNPRVPSNVAKRTRGNSKKMSRKKVFPQHPQPVVENPWLLAADGWRLPKWCFFYCFFFSIKCKGQSQWTQIVQTPRYSNIGSFFLAMMDVWLSSKSVSKILESVFSCASLKTGRYTKLLVLPLLVSLLPAWNCSNIFNRLTDRLRVWVWSNSSL